MSNQSPDRPGVGQFGLRPSGFFRPSAFGLRVSAASPRFAGERGVALVVTLIMLSVITFMAIAFLVLSRGERSSVGTATDQSLARLAADNASERVQIELAAPMMASGNFSSSGLMVSTNFVNPNGFVIGSTSPTNVAYQYPKNGGPLSPNDTLQNLNNLLFNPRPPVFIVTNRVTGASDSRYYVDLNRNGAFEPSGWIGLTNINGQQILDPKTGTPLVDFVQGDPQWIGGLEFPDRRHSADNRFLYRYAYLVVPASEALDINYIHNAARAAGNPPRNTIDSTGTDFLRNQGVGTWEINLASFLYDLNTNTYAWGGRYVYQPTTSPGGSPGNAFFDAYCILTNRYGGGVNYPARLASVAQLFNNGPAAFANHSFDAYTAGPLMTGPSAPPGNPDTFARTIRPWPGADNTNHYFSTQDLFDPAKTSFSLPGFSTRLQNAGANVDTYDRYTFYRLLSQLGTDSAPEPPGKINLNYDNKVQAVRGIVSATNFIPWRPVDFFTNTAAVLLTNAGFTLSLNNLQVYPTNFYTPSVHRLLQVAANIYDASTNRALAVNPQAPYYPSVFRPIFRRTILGTNTVVMIVGYREVLNAELADSRTAPVTVELDNPASPIGSPNSIPDISRRVWGTDRTEPMVSGIPLIIGAKKGFPNFNELAMQTQLYVSRLLEFRRDASGKVAETNQMYVVGVTNTFGLEAWNSYLTNYPRPLELLTTVSMTAIMTNETGALNVLFSNRVAGVATTNIPKNAWKGWAGGAGQSSMILPFGTASNFLFLKNSTYDPVLRQFVQQTHEFRRPGSLGAAGPFYVPHWWLNLNTKFRFILVDTAAGRIVDYVNINNWENTVDVNTILAAGNSAVVNAADYKNPANQWITNHLRNVITAPSYGVINQIQVGLNGTSDLVSFSQDPYSGLDVDKAVDGFRFNLLNAGPIFPSDSGKTFYKSNVFYAPFNPYRPIYIHTSWQANDPLVHYTAGDLTDLSLDPTNRVNFNTHNPPLDNLGQVNTRYRPWGGNPQSSDPTTDFQVAIKDPYVTRSDDWDFPNNKFPNVGWLGRVHRGTPWQTVFLKSTNFLQSVPGLPKLSLLNWQKWTGNPVFITNPALTNMVSPNLVGTNANAVAYDAIFTAPTNDWHILDLFTTAFNENAGRGQLSVNQTNLAAWSAVLSGVNVLSNANPAFPEFIQPAGTYNPASPLPALVTIVNGINNARTNFPNHAFSHLGDILSTPELTMTSPYLSTANKALLNDAVVERIPQQILGLLHGGEQPPRFVIYSYGQALKPAPRSFYMGSGPFFGLCTNYQITAEVATRTVVRIDGAPNKPRTVIESFSVLPPD